VSGQPLPVALFDRSAPALHAGRRSLMIFANSAASRSPATCCAAASSKTFSMGYACARAEHLQRVENKFQLVAAIF